jgi:hypothetical protein
MTSHEMSRSRLVRGQLATERKCSYRSERMQSENYVITVLQIPLNKYLCDLRVSYTAHCYRPNRCYRPETSIASEVHFRLFFNPEDGGNTFLQKQVHVWTTRRYILEDGKFRNYRCDNLKSYEAYFNYKPTRMHHHYRATSDR